MIREISKDGYRVIPIAIDKNGAWHDPVTSLRFLPKDVSVLIENEVSEYPEGRVAFLGDTQAAGLNYIDQAGLSLELDVVFPVLHGTYGEDGTIQGLLEMSGIPYVGCGVLASSCGMDKVTMRTLFRDAELPMCEYVWFLRKEWEQNNNMVISHVETKLGYPCFVKPANLGSSVGVTKATDVESLRAGINLASQYDRKIIIGGASRNAGDRMRRDW